MGFLPCIHSSPLCSCCLVCVASVTQAAITLHSCHQPQVQHVQSTTIPPNTPAVRLFNKLGFTHSRTVDRWPQEHLQSAYEAAVGFVPNREQPDVPVQFAPKQPHMLDHMPGWWCCLSCVVGQTSGCEG